MADNIDVDPGTGASKQPVATDDVGGAHYQRVKLDGGGDGLAVPITAITPADGTANQAGLPVSALLMGRTAAAGTWESLRVSNTTSDGQAGHAAGVLDVQAHNMAYNGTTWDRIRGDTTNGLDVDVTRLPSFPVNTSTTAATFAQAVNTIVAAATPEALVASQTLVESVLIQAKKGFNSSNTSAVFVGFSATNDSNYLELLPGDSVTFKAPQGKKLDLNLIYIECVTAGDGVSYTSVN